MYMYMYTHVPLNTFRAQYEEVTCTRSCTSEHFSEPIVILMKRILHENIFNQNSTRKSGLNIEEGGYIFLPV